MLDDIFRQIRQELEGAVPNRLAGAGTTTPWRGNKKQQKRKVNDRPLPKATQPGTKLTARRDRRGEDPWDWVEEKPPWEF
ncbi:hypothetical protein [Pseudoflavonifractor phocaeensis]|uniref:hypothetical protein n=1 Tax=Pseudoflavonifractor phocaeensis TaxID=1870988 RepID=UPI001958C5E3|nr:hypothetical protein [Pseudoflavonifractor phocaeensis]MBM6925187.1 hypothetical protein [Pseudoflavonifractor phocaeensis]